MIVFFIAAAALAVRFVQRRLILPLPVLPSESLTKADSKPLAGKLPEPPVAPLQADDRANVVGKNSEPAAPAVDVPAVDSSVAISAPVNPPPASLPNLAAAQNEQLRLLGEYRRLSGSPAFGRLMVFTYFPRTVSEAGPMAEDMASLIREFETYRIEPLVIIEPTDDSGENIAFADIAAGDFDPALQAYFAKLKEEGLTATQLGLWTPLPEPNIDEWGPANNAPGDFSAAFNRYGGIFKQNFADGRLSILLNDLAYDEKADDNAETPLDPYLNGLRPGLVASFGLQGFPDPDAEETANVPSLFLDSKLAVHCAATLGINSVWFNTGTYSSARAGNGKIVSLTDAERGSMLAGILREAVAAHTLGFSVFINLFAQDKRESQEATDWSYLRTTESRRALLDFISSAGKAGIPLSLFDSQFQ